MSIATEAILRNSNLKHVGLVIGGCNFVGYAVSAAFETHKITDLVGVGSFVAAAISLTLRNPELLSKVAVKSPFLAEQHIRLGPLHLCMGTARVFIANSLVIIWGARLSTYLFNRVIQLGEDKRLRKFYKEPGESYLDRSKSFFPVNLAAFWTIQAAWGCLCCLPVTLLNSVPVVSALSSTAGHSTLGELFARNKLAAAFPLSMRITGPLSFLKWVPVVLGLGGIAIESIADAQKSIFRADVSNKNKWCDTGLWSICRYPNYLGELMTWWSIWGLCAPALTPVLAAVSLVSPLFVNFLLVKVSGIPLLEATNDKKYAGNQEYAEYKRDTPVLMPNIFRLIFPSKPSGQSEKKD